MNLKSTRLYIDETDHVEKRIERSDEARQEAVAEQGEISEHVQKVETEKASNAMASLAEQQRLYGLLVLLAVVLFVADWPIQFGLNSVAFPSLQWVVLIVISVLVAAGLGVVVEVAAFAMFFDPYRPRRTVRLCLTSAAISGGLAAAAGTVLLFSRTASGEIVGFLTQAVPISMWTLGETLPVAAGFLSAAAWTLGYPKRRDNHIDRLKARLSELGRFIDWLDRDKQKLVGRIVTMLLVACLLTTPAFSLGGFTPPGGILTAGVLGLADARVVAAAAVRAGAQAPINRCLVYVDMTESVDPDFRRQTVARITDTLPQFLAAFHCTFMGAGTFADEGPFSPTIELPLVQAPQADDCAKATYRVEGLQKITQNLSGFQDYYHKRAELACRARTDAQFALFRQKSQDAITEIAAALNPDLPTRGRCTAIYSLLSRALTRGTTVVLVTDGLETCERNPQPVKLQEHRQLIFVLLPSRGSLRDAGRAALGVGNAWQQRVPGLQMVLPSDITPHLWDELAARSR